MSTADPPTAGDPFGFVALAARLIVLSAEDTSEDRHHGADIVEDVAYAGYCLRETASESPGVHAREWDGEETRRRGEAEAAVLAYRTLDITVSRGAELAGLPVGEFEEKLQAHDVRPRYGPTDPAELREEDLPEFE